MKNHCILMLLLLAPILAKSQASLQRSMNIGIQTSQQAMKVSRAVSMNNFYLGSTNNSMRSYKVTSRYIERRIAKKINDSIKFENETKKLDTILLTQKKELLSLINNSEKNDDSNISEKIKIKQKKIEKGERELLKNKNKLDEASQKIKFYKVMSKKLQYFIQQNHQINILQ